MMTHCSTSVIIPTYKASPFIRETLQSLFTQTRLPNEIVVVDDCSPDDTVAIVEQIARTSPVPIRMIRQEKNSGGPAVPIEVGVKNASSDLIAVLDQDDLFCPNKIEAQAGLLEKHSDIRFVFARCAFLDQPTVSMQPEEWVNELKARADKRSDHWELPGAQVLSLLVAHGNFIIGFPGFMFRRSESATRPLLDSTLRIAADYDLLCRICTGKVGFFDEIHYIRREHDNNVCRQRDKMLAEFEQVRSRYYLDQRLRALGSHTPLVRQAYFDIAYQARKSGEYASAASWLLASLWLWGPGTNVVMALLKLGPQAVISMLRNANSANLRGNV